MIYTNSCEMGSNSSPVCQGLQTAVVNLGLLLEEGVARSPTPCLEEQQVAAAAALSMSSLAGNTCAITCV